MQTIKRLSPADDYRTPFEKLCSLETGSSILSRNHRIFSAIASHATQRYRSSQIKSEAPASTALTGEGGSSAAPFPPIRGFSHTCDQEERFIGFPISRFRLIPHWNYLLLSGSFLDWKMLAAEWHFRLRKPRWTLRCAARAPCPVGFRRPSMAMAVRTPLWSCKKTRVAPSRIRILPVVNRKGAAQAQRACCPTTLVAIHA